MQHANSMIGAEKNGWKLVGVSEAVSSTGARKLIVARDERQNLRYEVTREQWNGEMERMAIAVAQTKVDGLVIRSERLQDLSFGRCYIPLVLASIPAVYWRDKFIQVLARRGKELFTQSIDPNFRLAMLEGDDYLMNNFPAPNWDIPAGVAKRSVREAALRKQTDITRAMDKVLNLRRELMELGGEVPASVARILAGVSDVKPIAPPVAEATPVLEPIPQPVVHIPHRGTVMSVPDDMMDDSRF